MRRISAGLIGLALLVPALAMAQTPQVRPDQQTFREIYKELGSGLITTR